VSVFSSLYSFLLACCDWTLTAWPFAFDRCIWDTTANEVAGWSLQTGDTGACFVGFTSPHHCDEWVSMRDKLMESEE
jgi:hypothetical protein